jgi:hypothetical protein
MNFPIVSQLTNVTDEKGEISTNAQMDCVAASVDAYCRFLLGQPENSVFDPDNFKDKAYSDLYTGGTSASAYVAFCKSLGITLHAVDAPDPVQLVAQARALIKQGVPAIFTELDPYVDTNLTQYQNWTHVCVWYGEDAIGLTAMDPYIANPSNPKPVYKSDASWASALRSNQLWIAEKAVTSGCPENWKDDGTTLIAPNNVAVVHGFRGHVLASHWDPNDWPEDVEHSRSQLEDSNPSLGGGTQQLFRYSMLGWTPARGVFVEYIGTELAKSRQLNAKWTAYAGQLETIIKQLQALPQ